MPEFHGPKADMMALVWKAIDVEKIEVDEDYKFYKSEGLLPTGRKFLSIGLVD